MKLVHAVLVASGAMVATAHADQGLYDVRSAYMGGTGVAGQRATAGIPLNPANMALPSDGDRFGVTVPVLAADINDPSDLHSQVKTVQDTYLNQITNDINALQQAQEAELSIPNGPYSSRMSDLGSLAGRLSTILQDDSGKQVTVTAAAGLGLAVPRPALAMGVDAKGMVGFVGTPHVSPQDLELLTDMNAVFSKGYVTTADKLRYPQLFSSGLSPSSYSSTSTATLVGLQRIEEGVSLAHQFALAGDHQAIAVGITPKMMQLTTYDYTSLLNGSNGFSTSELKHFKTTNSLFNADLGATYQANAHWRTGVVVNNVVAKTLKTYTGRHIKLAPQVTAGMAYRGGWFNWSLDADLTKQTDLGFNTGSQIVATGVELSAWNKLRVGLGFRHNLIDSALRDTVTAGVSTALLGVNVGVAAQANRHQKTAVLQLSLEY